MRGCVPFIAECGRHLKSTKSLKGSTVGKQNRNAVDASAFIPSTSEIKEVGEHGMTHMFVIVLWPAYGLRC